MLPLDHHLSIPDHVPDETFPDSDVFRIPKTSSAHYDEMNGALVVLAKNRGAHIITTD
jgi:hypothetical protein